MNPRTMTDHKLTPLKFYHDGTHLVCNAVPDATEASQFVEQATPAGRCMHLVKTTGSNALSAAKLGCAGNEKVPVFIFRPSDSYSAGFAGPDVATAMQPGWNAGGTGAILMFVGMEGFELETTEFDTTRTYSVGDYLVAPEWNAGSVSPTPAVHAQTVAGVLTKHDTSLATPGVPKNGASTIIGIVSPGSWTPLGYDPSGGQPVDAHRNKVITFYTTYRPAIQGLKNATPVNL